MTQGSWLDRHRQAPPILGDTSVHDLRAGVPETLNRRQQPSIRRRLGGRQLDPLEAGAEDSSHLAGFRLAQAREIETSRVA